MFYPDSEKNKFGYYVVGDYKTYSKFEAISKSQYNKQNIDWVFNDEIFSSYDWKTEPTATLEDLYKLQAQHIRDTYDYVVLMFSGGADSTNMLHAFVDNGIHIDEICSVYERDGAKDDDNYLTAEILNSAIPYVNKLTANGLTTRYRLLDTSTWQYNNLNRLTVDSRENSYYDFNSVHNLGNLTGRFSVRENVADYQRIIESGKRLCLVWAEGKPIINVDNGKHKVVFVDKHDWVCGPRLQNDNHPGYHDELFYYSTKYPEIMIKQAHLCLRYLKNYNLHKDSLVAIDKIPRTVESAHDSRYHIVNPVISSVYTEHSNKKYCLNLSTLHSTIYPAIEPILYSQGKNANRLIHPRDMWLTSAANNLTKTWYYGYLHHVNNLGNDWVKTIGDRGTLTELPTVATLRKAYFIE